MNLKAVIRMTVSSFAAAIMLCGCGNTADTGLIVGKWTVYSAQINGKDADISPFRSDKNYFIFSSDGGAVSSNNNTAKEGSFEFDGEVVTLTLGESSQKLLLNGKYLYMTLNDQGNEITMVYQKTD